MLYIVCGDLLSEMLVICSSSYWTAALWDVHVVASPAVPGGSRANLYFHGWLFEASRARGKGFDLLQPIVIVSSAHGSIKHDGGALQGRLPPSSSFSRTACTITAAHSCRSASEMRRACCSAPLCHLPCAVLSLPGPLFGASIQRHAQDCEGPTRTQRRHPMDTAKAQMVAGPGCAVVACIDTRVRDADGQPETPESS